MNLTQSVQKYVNSPGSTFKIFRINYSNAMTRCLKNFDISIVGNKTYDFWGRLDESGKDLMKFLLMLGNNDPESVRLMRRIIESIVKKVCDAYGKDCVWVSLRITLPEKKYEPRWHVDGTFFEKDHRIQSKFVTVLKGDGTLFAVVDGDTRTKFLDSRKIVPWNYEEVQAQQNKIIAGAQGVKFLQLANSQGAIFLVGNDKMAAIHSEPPFNQKRIFLSILPGDKSEIEQLTNRWKVPFGEAIIK
ncbi:MAG: hypothetical protein Harvfovirus55_3 [Harvfovirus sp.]|uniref:Uncharacterized protein n=1 Tax=Harvfovirus sp. TaxID=2487768 RepID=A0A3G5A5D1_9VIRU|nr:MAG: hypothetical protein Harvfovirus55_3 [Harvfovirus sp.]